MAYGAVDVNKFASANPADQNSMAISAGYTGKEDYLNNRGSTQSSSGSTGSIGNTASWEDTVKKAIEMQKTANAPAVASMQAQIPEIASQYAAQKANVTAQQQTLSDRYKNLLDSLNTNKTADVNKQTLITSNELGKRGILPASTLAQQEVQNAVQPVTAQYNNLQTQTALDQTSGQQSLEALMNQLTSGQVADTRSVNNAIAQLQSGAASSGITTGSNLYGQNQATLAAQAAQLYKEQQDKIANDLAQQQINKLIELPSTGGYMYNPKTGGITEIGGGNINNPSNYYNTPTSPINAVTDNKLVLNSQYNPSWPKPPPNYGYNSSGQLLPL